MQQPQRMAAVPDAVRPPVLDEPSFLVEVEARVASGLEAVGMQKVAGFAYSLKITHVPCVALFSPKPYELASKVKKANADKKKKKGKTRATGKRGRGIKASFGKPRKSKKSNAKAAPSKRKAMSGEDEGPAKMEEVRCVALHV